MGDTFISLFNWQRPAANKIKLNHINLSKETLWCDLYLLYLISYQFTMGVLYFDYPELVIIPKIIKLHHAPYICTWCIYLECAWSFLTTYVLLMQSYFFFRAQVGNFLHYQVLSDYSFLQL